MMADPLKDLLEETEFDWHPREDDLSLSEPNPFHDERPALPERTSGRKSVESEAEKQAP